MKKILLSIKISFIVSLLVVASITSLFGQYNLSIQKCNTNSEVIALIDSVLLSNVEDDHKANITFAGDPGAVGYFDHGYFFGFQHPKGMVLSTGFSDDLDDSNTCLGQTSSNTGGGSDSDLASLSGQSIYDACVIEFDIKSFGDTIKLNTVFSSEEYHEYVNTAFNDAYGIFLSGPGISGPYTNDAILISLVPGTSLPVAISNINCGNEPQGCDPNLGAGNNCNLLVDNLTTSNSGFNQFALDGYTVPLQSGNAVTPDNWYHVKIAIGDGGDAVWDSGVFLEKGMFVPGPPETSLAIAECETEENVIALIDSVLLKNIDVELKKNITFTGDPASVGYYSNADFFNFESEKGIVLSTGFAGSVDTANTCTGNLSGNTSGGYDADLAAVSSQTINDAVIIEFDIKPTGDSISFNTIFGSEDYHENAGYQFYDTYGLFLSGPGINGPFSNNAINIGLVPDSDDAVNIHNINCGYAAQDCDPTLGSGDNCTLLVDNLNTTNPGFDQFAIDGYTVPIAAGNSLIGNNWYHVKIAIGDGEDEDHDSGIFLEEGIFMSASSNLYFNIAECQTEAEVISLVDSVLLYNIDAEYKNNITFSGDPGAVGYFSKGDFLNFEQSSGIVLSTGFTNEMDAANSCNDYVSGATDGGSDPDLQTLSGQSINDACVIEFDIKSMGDSLFMNTVFSSEEYHEWANTQFIDAYGIFLSGPGINGPFTNDAINIGLIPGSNLPVTINSVNCGNAPAGCDPTLGGGNNCEFLVDNLNTSNVAFSQFAYDGYTTPFIAGNMVEANAWYHVKIAIGDASDAHYDSGIFLEKGLYVYDSIFVSVDEPNEKTQIQLIPNPAKDYFEINSNLNIDKISIFDLNGKLLKTEDLSGRRVSLSNLPKGMLIIELTSGNYTFREKLLHR